MLTPLLAHDLHYKRGMDIFETKITCVRTFACRQVAYVKLATCIHILDIHDVKRASTNAFMHYPTVFPSSTTLIG